jgi:IS30 family transposase
MTYKQLTYAKRYVIYICLKAGKSIPEIAQLLGFHKTSIYREIERNKGRRGYRPKQAQESATARRCTARKNIHFHDQVQELVEYYLKQDWSPEQISGYLKKEHNVFISHERIYQHVWEDKRTGGTLYTHLRWSQKKRKKRYGKRDRRGQIKDRVSIDQRPEIVAKKERIGDWEIDTIIGKNHKGALVTAVERSTKFLCLHYVPHKSAALVSQALINMLLPYQSNVLTITADNGKEFAHHKQIAQALDADVYFAHPYHSWERGLNENTNGLIRQYFPKKYDFSTITKEQVTFVENRINHRPRKMLKFEKPQNIFLNNLVALGT